MRVRRWTKVFAFIAVGALIATACSKKETPSGGDGSTATGGGTIIHGTTDTIVTLDPAGQYDFGSFQISQQIYNTVLELPPSGTVPEPVLASACQYDDPQTFTCTLKPDLKFSDGSDLTSEDIAFSLKRNIEINDPNGACSLLRALAECGKWNDSAVETPDPQTVVFHLLKPDATFPQVLTTSAAFIVPSDLFSETEEMDSDKVIGSGRYTLAKYEEGTQVVLEKNPTYFGDAPLNDRVIVQYFDKSSALKLALEEGSVDIAWRTMTPTDITALSSEDGINVLTGPGGEIRYLGFNESFPDVDKLAVRQAVAMTVDRQAIVDNVYEGTVEPLWSMVPVGFGGHIDAFKDAYGDAPDIPGATKVLKDAGVQTPVSLEIWWTPTHYGDSSADEYAEIKRSLEASGLFKITLKSTEWEAYSEAVTTDQYQSFQLGWFPDYVDADNYAGTFYGSDSYLNDHFSDPKIDKLIDQERASTDQTERDGFFEQLQTLAAEQVPIVPIWQGQQVAAVRDGINGVQETLDPAYIFRYWLISKSA